MPPHQPMSYDEYDAEQEGDSGYTLPEPLPPAPVARPESPLPPPPAAAAAYFSDDSRTPSPEEYADPPPPPAITAADKQIAELWNSCSSYPFEYMDEDRRAQLIAYAAAIRAGRHGDLSAIPRPTIGRDDILIEFAMLYASVL